MRIAPLLVTTAAICATLSATPCFAQGKAADGVTSFQASFFARTQPTNAYEMILLVPSFRLIKGVSDVRGYAGSAGNVLIDGQRPSGKAEDLKDVLKRIPVTVLLLPRLVPLATFAANAIYPTASCALLTNSSPARVSFTPPWYRVNRGTPRLSSSSRTLLLTADCCTPMISAARLKL